MRTVHVHLQDRSYDIHIANGVLSEAGSILKKLGASQDLVVITNAKVGALHGNVLMKSLAKAGFASRTILVSDGERFKTLSTMQFIYKRLARYRVDRKTWLLALGGGVIGDMAGFAAATYLRGIPLVQIPTTLLSQIDSSIGGKTGVNLNEGKNLVGAFYQPAAVLIDPLLLRTLPLREFRSGIYEALKYGIIRDDALFRLIDRKHPHFPESEPRSLEGIIKRCVAIKAEVVSKDERESKLRMVLNFGHTYGHALEAVTNYRRFTHGEAIGHGMIMAAHLSHNLNWLGTKEALQIQQVVSRVSPLPSVSDLSPQKILHHLMSDKKAFGQKVRFVLPRRIGQVEIASDVSMKDVACALQSYLYLGPYAFAC
jgi:3-dehydroquinate synthase